MAHEDTAAGDCLTPPPPRILEEDAHWKHSLWFIHLFTFLPFIQWTAGEVLHESHPMKSIEILTLAIRSSCCRMHTLSGIIFTFSSQCQSYHLKSADTQCYWVQSWGSERGNSTHAFVHVYRLMHMFVCSENRESPLNNLPVIPAFSV